MVNQGCVFTLPSYKATSTPRAEPPSQGLGQERPEPAVPKGAQEAGTQGGG